MRIYKKAYYRKVKPSPGRGEGSQKTLSYFFWTPMLNRISSLLLSLSEA
jgi:hypothetical protein